MCTHTHIPAHTSSIHGRKLGKYNEAQKEEIF
jgi:hypothetical protein